MLAEVSMTGSPSQDTIPHTTSPLRCSDRDRRVFLWWDGDTNAMMAEAVSTACHAMQGDLHTHFCRACPFVLSSAFLVLSRRLSHDTNLVDVDVAIGGS
eukprot:1451855-Amphidinium_carterae.2